MTGPDASSLTKGRALSTTHHPHGIDELCEPGAALYARALRAGRLPHAAAESAPCLLDMGLLQPDVADAGLLLPTPPAVALPRLLHTIEEDVTLRRQKEAALAEAFSPLLALDADHRAPAGDSSITALKGLESLRKAAARAAAETREEVLAIRRGKRYAESLDERRGIDVGVLKRGGRLRTLYQHTSRHSPVVSAHFERLGAYDFQARSLDHIPERLAIFDRKVAFVPSAEDPDLAVEVRHPTLVSYLVSMYQELWRSAVPLFPRKAHLPAPEGFTARQRAIARLLVEGQTDARIAERLGMNVRTCRTHIGNLATALGSSNRAQLGYLIGKSGMLDDPE